MRVPYAVLIAAMACAPLAAKDESPTGNRMTPPTLREISPLGLGRGITTEVSIVGYNLAHASAIYFSEPGVQGRIESVKDLPDQDDVRLGENGTPLSVDLGPLPLRNEVIAEVDVPDNAPIGPLFFRVLTPLGLSPQGTLVIQPYWGEQADMEPNDSAEQAQKAYLPAVLVGAISKPGDEDWYKVNLRAGQQIVFQDMAKPLGSMLMPVVTVLDASQNAVAAVGGVGTRADRFGTFQAPKDGEYFLRITDAANKGSARHFYRLLAGEFPVVSAAYPAGVQSGKKATVNVTGVHLAGDAIGVEGRPTDGQYDSLWLRPTGPSQELAFNRIKLAVGVEPEVDAKAVRTGQSLAWPVTVNGRLENPEQRFRFHAKRGQKLIFEVNAARLGSELDSKLEVLDAAGKPVERATVRAIAQTSTALRDHDSAGIGIRLDSVNDLRVNDYLMIGAAIYRITAMPRGPDDDAVVMNFGGRRLGFLDTTPEAHAMDTPVYKVEIYEPGRTFPPNGLPLVHLMYANDDGGPGYDTDSLLHFTAPADGDYQVRLTDTRGKSGASFFYRLTIREPRPDYRLDVNPRNANVPIGGDIPITVTALRLDGDDAPIPVQLAGLPPGLHSNSGVIAPGQDSVTLSLSADADAKLAKAAPLRVIDEKGREASSTDHLKLIALTPRADVEVEAVTKEVTLEPGRRATVELTVSRNNGFGGRVPIEVRNLPPSVRVTDVGLNGVLVTEKDTRRTFTLEALPDAAPLEQPIYLSGLVETRASQQNSFMSGPIKLKIVSAKTQLSQK